MYKFHDTTTHMRTHTHDHRLQSDINTILIITNQVEITITIITISSVDTQHLPPTKSDAPLDCQHNL